MRNHCPLLQIEAATAEHDIVTAVGAVTPINGSSSGRVLARQRASGSTHCTTIQRSIENSLVNSPTPWYAANPWVRRDSLS